MNTKYFKRTQERTEKARKAIAEGCRAALPKDIKVGQTFDGSQLMERTVITEIDHAAFLGFDWIAKAWTLDDKYVQELTSAGFAVKKDSRDLTEISWSNK